MARIHGQRGKMYLSPGTGAAVNIINLSSWTLDSTTDKVEVTAFTDANKTFVTGLPDLKGTFSGFYDATDRKVFDAADGSQAGTAQNMYIYPDSAAPTKYAYGTCFVDVSLSGSVNGAVTTSGNFVAAGTWELGFL